MFKILFILLVTVPIVELWGLLTIGQWIGGLNTIGLVILTGGLGAWLARREGVHAISLARVQLSRGEIPGQAAIDGICILVGGVLLLTPGFFTDSIGFILLIPYTRNLIKAWLRNRLEEMIRSGRFIIYRK